jgi:hypothetical protein
VSDASAPCTVIAAAAAAANAAAAAAIGNVAVADDISKAKIIVGKGYDMQKLENSSMGENEISENCE